MRLLAADQNSGTQEAVKAVKDQVTVNAHWNAKHSGHCRAVLPLRRAEPLDQSSACLEFSAPRRSATGDRGGARKISVPTRTPMDAGDGSLGRLRPTLLPVKMEDLSI